MPAPIRSPFTAEQQRELNDAQRDPSKLEFTCPNDGAVLVAGPHWTCPSCEYTQYWAHADMALTVADMRRRAADAQNPPATPLAAAEAWLRRCASGDWPTAGATVKHLPVLMAEHDRRGQIVDRARKVEDGTVTNGGPWRQNAEIAEWILRGGES
jgi:ribosomal protein S27AE